MTRSAVLAAVAILICAPRVRGQDVEPRVAEYGFATTIDDARAIWINPAGLAAFAEASVTGEIVLERPGDEPFEVGQWTVGFNSRGFAFAYQRDRHPFRSSAAMVRFGVGFGFSRGSIGLALTSYSSDDITQRGADVGVRLDPTPGLTFGGVVRHIGRPTVRTISLPIIGVVGASWTPVPRHLQIAGEAHAIERSAPATGYDTFYRVGGRLSTRGRLPFGILTTLDLGSNFKIDRWTVGFAIGGNDHLLATGSVVPLIGGSQHLQAVSLTGVASRRAAGRQF